MAVAAEVAVAVTATAVPVGWRLESSTECDEEAKCTSVPAQQAVSIPPDRLFLLFFLLLLLLLSLVLLLMLLLGHPSIDAMDRLVGMRQWRKSWLVDVFTWRTELKRST